MISAVEIFFSCLPCTPVIICRKFTLNNFDLQSILMVTLCLMQMLIALT